MRKTIYLTCCLLALLIGSGSAWALSLNEAMSALPAAKEAGLLGEQWGRGPLMQLQLQSYSSRSGGLCLASWNVRSQSLELIL